MIYYYCTKDGPLDLYVLSPDAPLIETHSAFTDKDNWLETTRHYKQVIICDYLYETYNMTRKVVESNN